MRTVAPAELPLFRSDLQARLLSALVLEPEARLTGADLARLTGAARATVHRELHRLLDAGMLEREQVGRATVYRAATASPLFEPLRMLLERTVGVEPELSRRLATLDGVEAAAVFGSWASRRAGPDSDVDVLVVGEVDRAALLVAIREVEQRAGREISVRLYRRPELERRLAAGSGFLGTLLARPMTPLVGRLPIEASGR